MTDLVAELAAAVGTAQVRTGDLVKQGFPFFSGSVVLEREIDVNAQPGEKVFLEFDGLEAITTQVTVNGKVAGMGTRSSLKKGKILFQSELAEIYFRKIELRQLKTKG